MYDTTAKSVDGTTEVDSLATYNSSNVNLLSTRDDYSIEVKDILTFTSYSAQNFNKTYFDTNRDVLRCRMCSVHTMNSRVGD